MGVPDEAAGAGGAAPQEALTNQPAIDLLRRLPGKTIEPLRPLRLLQCARWCDPICAGPQCVALSTSQGSAFSLPQKAAALPPTRPHLARQA